MQRLENLVPQVTPSPAPTLDVTPTATTDEKKAESKPERILKRLLADKGGLSGSGISDLDRALNDLDAGQRRQVLAQMRELLSGRSASQLRTLALETKQDGLRQVAQSLVDSRETHANVFGDTTFVTPQEATPVRLVLAEPRRPGRELAQSERAPLAPFRENVDLGGQAQRVTDFLFGRGGGRDVLLSAFYGLSKPAQAQLEVLIGQRILAEPRGTPQPAVVTPGQRPQSDSRGGQQPSTSSGDQRPLTPDQRAEAQRAFNGTLHGRYSVQERQVFRALRQNTDSRFALEDQIFMAAKGLQAPRDGNNILRSFDSLSQAGRSEVARRYERKYNEQFPPRLPELLGRVQTGELNETNAQIRLLEAQERPGDSDIALLIWRVSTGNRGSKGDMRALFAALEWTALEGRFEAIEALYARALGGPEMLRELSGQIGRNSEHPEDMTLRMSQLVEGQFDAYLATTARMHLSGKIDTDELLHALQSFFGEGQRVSPSQLQTAYARGGGTGDLIEQLRARDPRLDTLLASSADNDVSTAADNLYRALLGQGVERGPSVSMTMRRVSREDWPRFAQTFEHLHGISVEDAIRRSFTMRTTAQSGPLDRELVWRERLLRETREGELPLVDLLVMHTQSAAEDQELTSAMARSTPEVRSGLRAAYEARFGAGSFDRIVARMPPALQALLITRRA